MSNQIAIDAVKSFQFLDLPFTARPEYLVVGDKIYFATQRILKAAKNDDWRTDADEFGIGCIQLKPEPVLSHWVLPVRFSMRAAGSPSKRKVRLVMLLNDGSLILTVQSPFSGGSYGGWGDDNYIFNLEPPTVESPSPRWGLVKDSESGERVMYILPEVGADEPCNSSWSAGFNQLLVWQGAEGLLNVFADPTPYFIDDWEQDEATKQAYRELEKAHQRDRTSLTGFFTSQKQRIDYDEGYILVNSNDPDRSYRINNLLQALREQDPRLKGLRNIAFDENPCDEQESVGVIITINEEKYLVLFPVLNAGSRHKYSYCGVGFINQQP
jgi:hypothetical protein